MKSAKVKKILLTAMSLVLVATLAVAGTVAYLQGSTDDVVNSFSTNNVDVDLKETTNGNYNIIPGTSETKDPKVTVNASLPAYVYVEVTDETQGLVTYEIADGWTKLDGYDNVYYREFTPSEDDEGNSVTTAEYGVLKDDQVSYAASLTNEDMKNEDGSQKSDIQLTFKAYAIQKEGFTTAKEGWQQIPAEVSTGEELLEALEEDKPILLTDDIDLTERGDYCYQENGSWHYDWIEIHINDDCNLDLGGHTLTSRCRLRIGNKATVTISNGTLISQPCTHIWNSAEIIFALQVGNANLTLNDVNLKIKPEVDNVATQVSTVMQISSHDDVKDSYGDTTVTINGGTIEGEVSVQGIKDSNNTWHHTTVNFNGGTVINQSESSSAFSQGSGSTLNINGGTVDCAYVNSLSNAQNGETIFNISDGTFTVSKYVFYNTKYYTTTGTSISLTGGTFNEQTLAEYVKNVNPYKGTTYVWGETDDGYTVVRKTS